MANNNLNPISRLLDIDFPDIKRANWNNSYDAVTTASPGFVQVVHTDHIMAGTRAKLDFNSASFANSTIAPLYGRYKVKYLAVWAPDRLYMADWLTGEKMDDDNYPYPYITAGSTSAHIGKDPLTYQDFSSYHNFNRNAAISSDYVPPTSLCSYLRLFPAMYCPKTFSGSPDDSVPYKNAFAFLTFWDAYRTFILNPQEKQFPVRTRAFIPEVVRRKGNETLKVDAQNPLDTFCNVSDLDDFFKAVKRSEYPMDVIASWRNIFGFDPIFSPRYVYALGENGDLNPSDNATLISFTSPDSVIIHHNYHYGLPMCTFKPDMFTSFISNENVEVERNKSKVRMNVQQNGDTSFTEFTMEQWYLASRIQSKIRKNLYQFEDFAQWIDTNFGVKPSTTLTQPMFLGAFESDVIFNDVISSVQQGDATQNSLGSNSNLGSRAGFGVGKNGNESTFFDFTAKEPGTVMILQMIVPEVFYFEFSDPLHNTLNFNEEFNPIFDALGFQDLAKGDVNMVPNLVSDPDCGVIPVHYTWSVYNSALAQQPYGMEHMGKQNILLGQMVEPTYYQSWSLARSFNYLRSSVRNPLTMPQRSLYSTYVIPEMFQNIFASSPHTDNFQFYLSFDYRKYQPVSKQFLSFR